jgi:hypothetical protein
MTVLALIGALAVTAVLFYATFSYIGGLYMQHGFAGLDMLSKKQWVAVVLAGAVLVGLWIAWYLTIGSMVVVDIK